MYDTASGGALADGGFKIVTGRVGESKRDIHIKFRVAPVHRMLLAISEMVDQGLRVVFEATGGKDTSYLEVKATGERIPLVRRRRVYVIDLGVRAGVGEGAASSRDFPWQGARL